MKNLNSLESTNMAPSGEAMSSASVAGPHPIYTHTHRLGDGY